MDSFHIVLMGWVAHDFLVILIFIGDSLNLSPFN